MNNFPYDLDTSDLDDPPPAPRRKRAEKIPPPMSERIPPHNLDAEQGLLASIILDAGGNILADCVENKITPDFFFTPAHQHLYQAILNLSEKYTGIDEITLCESCRSAGTLEAIGGPAYINELTNRIEVTTHASHWLGIVREKAIKRKIISFTLAISEAAFDPAGDPQKIQKLNQQLYALHDDLSEIGGESARAVGRTPFSLQVPPINDASVLLGTNRYLARGDAMIVFANAGMGKSSWQTGAALSWALGKPWLGIQCNGSLKSLIIQSEDSEGDVAEAVQSYAALEQLNESQRKTIDENVIFVRDRIRRGAEFVAHLRKLVRIIKPDIVWVNPLISFAGVDVTDAEAMSEFLYGGLNRVNADEQFAYVVMHHTPKPVKESDKKDWSTEMYAMAGSHVLADWARAAVSIKATTVQGKFRMILAKRGTRAGVTKLDPGKDTYGNWKRPEIITNIPVEHVKERIDVPTSSGGKREIPAVHWIRSSGDDEEGNPVVEGDGGKGSGGHNRAEAADIWAAVPDGEEFAITMTRLVQEVKEQFGIGKSTIQKYIYEWRKQGIVTYNADKHLYRVPGKEPKI